MATSPAFAHRLPHVFRDPDSFEPERFVAPRDEDKAAPFSFIGFGGGRHGCMGSNFAILQVCAHSCSLPSLPANEAADCQVHCLSPICGLFL